MIIYVLTLKAKKKAAQGLSPYRLEVASGKRPATSI
jgi:hypothetical protein